MSSYTLAIIGGAIALVGLLLIQFASSSTAQELSWFTLYLIGAWVVTGLHIAQHQWWWVTADLACFALISQLVARRAVARGRQSDVEK